MFQCAKGQKNVLSSNTFNYKDETKHRKRKLCHNCKELGYLAKDCFQPLGKCPRQFVELVVEVETPLMSKA